jgi:hypothetical protein
LTPRKTQNSSIHEVFVFVFRFGFDSFIIVRPNNQKTMDESEAMMLISSIAMANDNANWFVLTQFRRVFDLFDSVKTLSRKPKSEKRYPPPLPTHTLNLDLRSGKWREKMK